MLFSLVRSTNIDENHHLRLTRVDNITLVNMDNSHFVTTEHVSLMRNDSTVMTLKYTHYSADSEIYNFERNICRIYNNFTKLLVLVTTQLKLQLLVST